jgi:hypothetical protein
LHGYAKSVAWFAVTGLSVCVSAQDIPSLSVSPEKATMMVGETRSFRAVGKDGRIRHNVRWSLSPPDAAKLTVSGDEATLQGEHETFGAALVANADGLSAEAAINIRSGTLPTGTQLWSVAPLPGCKAVQITQAVPSANGPDLYVEDDCPQGRFIRALTSDGREIWRKQITGTPVDLSDTPAPQPAGTEHSIDLHPNSVCDQVSTGMTKDEVAKLANIRKLQLGRQEAQGDHWSLEEKGSRCTILFDGKRGVVVKKTKIIVLD